MTHGLNEPNEQTKLPRLEHRFSFSCCQVDADYSLNSKSLRDCSFISQDASSEFCVTENPRMHTFPTRFPAAKQDGTER